MKKHIAKLSLFSFSILFSSNFIKVSIDNISSNRVLSATQDSSGFIWIGTDEGLNRFDGNSNKTYRSNIFNENTVSGNRIWITHLDDNNTLWVGTDRGVCYYDKDYDFFHRIETGSKPLHVAEDDNSLYFTTTNNGVFKISKKNKEVLSYQFDPLDPFSLSSSRFSENQTTPLATHNEFLWVGTTNGLNKTNTKTGQTKRLYSGKTDLVKADTVTSVLVVEDRLYVGTAGGLGISDLSFGGSVKKNIGTADTSYIVALFEIKEKGAVAVVLKNKIIILKNDNISQNIKIEKPLKKVTNLKTGQYLLTSDKHKDAMFLNVEENEVIDHRTTPTPTKVKDIFVDKEGGVWIVGDDGALRAGNTTSPIKNHPQIKTEIGKFSKTEEGLFLLKDKSVLEYHKKTTPNKKIKISKSTRDKKLYTSKDNRFFLYDKNIEEIKSNGALKKIASFNTTINTVFSHEKHLFLSLKNSGIVYHNLETGTTTDYRKNRLLAKSLPSGATSFLLNETTLWVGNDESGLYELDINNAESPRLIKHHTYTKTNPRSFSSSSVSCLIKHSDLLFVGTSGDGLYVYMDNGFNRVSIDDGLPSNNIISLTGSSDSTIWALTNGGLSLIDWKEKNVSNVGPQEGLLPYFRDQNTLVSKKDGDAFVVSPKGLQEVVVDQLYTNKYEAVVVIESVELIDRQNKKHQTNKKDIRVEHTTPVIKINLTSPALYKADKTTFSYFVQGYNKDWVDNGTRRYIELQGLDAGPYLVKINSYNNDGFQSKNTAELAFQVIPPWWETWWAYLSYALLILVVVVYYVKYKTKAQERASEEKRKEEELEEARQFQLDMLPRETPEDLGLDISAAIQTASEVGGDYYDFFPQKDKESLYVVVGDATGHGMTAGMMVSITKAGLYGIPSIPPNEVAKRLNRVIKAIDLGWNRMAFNMARFWEDRVEFTSAAMPPVYHYHSKTGEVDEILIGGLPLGSIKDETFVLENFGFETGDSLVFISDGLPEAINRSDEMLGYEAVYDCVRTNGEQGAEAQKQALLDLGSSWLGDIRNQDDITIVVVKKTISLE